MIRPSKDEYYLNIALEVSKRSTCIRKRYGAIIVKNDRIVATGYNGSPRGEVNCCDLGYCMRVESKLPDYSDCNSVHAEQNAMLSASREDMDGATLYLACEALEDKSNTYIQIPDPQPCPICLRMIKNSGISRIVTRSDIYHIREEGIQPS